MKNLQGCAALSVFVVAFGAASAHAQGVQAVLRSSSALVPSSTVGATAPTAPAGGAVVGAQPWLCDAAQGFARLVSLESGVLNPVLGLATPGLHLPISPTTVPATCGQMAADGLGDVYITQGVVDTTVTPSVARGVLRETLDPQTGAIVGSGAYIATTAGLDGDQPTASAIGPDGNLYVAFLKSGNIKRVIKPAVGTTQVVQSVGSTPNGHFGRALAFVGNDLYVGSIDAFSVIHNATSPSCTGGCNAAVIADGFSGVAHVGITSDGLDTVYFAVASPSQVWRYTPSTGLFNFIAQGGADPNGGNASSFSFVAAKTNLLTLDGGGNLWIGDDTSNATRTGAGRVWTVSSSALAGITGGSPIAGTNLQLLFNALRGPWQTLIVETIFTPTFNADGTFSATIQASSGAIATDSGVWTLTPPINPQPVSNPQGHLTFVDSLGVVLLSGDALLLKPDQVFMESVTTTLSSQTIITQLVLTKVAP